MHSTTTRREFLVTSALGGVGLAAAALSQRATAADKPDEMKPANRIPDTHTSMAVEASDVAKTAEGVLEQVGRGTLEEAVRLGCRWLTEIAQVQTEQLGENDDNCFAYPYDNWKGAMRSHYGGVGRVYRAAVGKWQFYGVVWHTGQACKALSLAYRCFRDEAMLKGAKLAAGFLRRQQIIDPNHPDFGMIVAYEDGGLVPFTNTSCILECCDGLFVLSDVTGDPQYAQWACDAILWAVNRVYRGDGRFHDAYDPNKREIGSPWKDRWGETGRPLLDDGVLLKAAVRTKNEKLRKTLFEIADRLLRTEDPPGNWMAYMPCDWQATSIHPRQAFWWGRPMWMAYRESGEQKYRDCFDRACQWYVRAMRRDGAIIRNTFADFTSESFGHTSSATACACMMFRDQYVHLGNTAFVPHLVKGLKYLHSVQFAEAQDPNLHGAILESVVPPKRTDACPWFLRDIATSFFVTAASQVLLDATSQLSTFPPLDA